MDLPSQILVMKQHLWTTIKVLTYIKHVLHPFHSWDKMASMFLPRHYLQTTCELGYTNNIEKIPEPYRINQWEHYMLPCSNDYSMMALCDNPFEIISAIYGMENVQNSVISHLKKYRKYYTTVSAEYLNTKKLYF